MPRDPGGGGTTTPRATLAMLARRRANDERAELTRLRSAYIEKRTAIRSAVLQDAAANPNVNVSAYAPGLRNLGAPIVWDPRVPAADTSGYGRGTTVRVNPLIPRQGLGGVLAHEFVHVAQRQFLGGIPAQWAQPAGLAMDILRGATAGTTFRQFTEPPAYYLGGAGNTRTSLSQVNPWLRPIYSRIFK